LFRQCRFWATRLGSPGPLATGVSPPGDRPCGLQQAGPRGERKFPPRCIRHIHNSPQGRPTWLLIMVCFLTAPALAAPPGTIISNQAFVAYENAAGLPTLVASNEVQLVTAVIRSPASLAFTRVVTAGTFRESVGPAACLQSGAFISLPDPIISGGLTIDPALTQDVSVTSSYNLGEPFMLRLDDITHYAAHHHLVDSHRVGIRLAVIHPAAHVGIDRQINRTHQELTCSQSRQRRFDQTKISFLRKANRPCREHDLAICITHRTRATV